MSLEQAKLTPATEWIGADLTGVDVEQVAKTDEFTDLLKKAVDKHLVVRIRNQMLSGPTVEYLTSRFGPLMDIKRKGNDAHHVPGCDFIKVISNGTAADGRPLGDGNASAQIWHSDSTPWETPCGWVAFYCRQVPEVPPKTSFMNMRKVYKMLPEKLKERIENLRVIHHQYPRQIEVKIAEESPSLPLEQRKTGRVHPLVRRHLGTQEPILYLPTRRDSLVVGMSDQESRDLLEELWTIVDNAPYHWGAALMPNDFIIWDNSSSVHAREGWPEEQTRVMWHISAYGEVPIPIKPHDAVNVAGMDKSKLMEANRVFETTM